MAILFELQTLLLTTLTIAKFMPPNLGGKFLLIGVVASFILTLVPPFNFLIFAIISPNIEDWHIYNVVLCLVLIINYAVGVTAEKSSQ